MAAFILTVDNPLLQIVEYATYTLLADVIHDFAQKLPLVYAV